MLRAAPGEHLDFSVDARPSDQRTATPGSPTTRQLRKRRERLEQARMRIQAARESRAEPKWVEVIPVYDDEFARVAAVLEASNGDAPEPFDAEATFDESVWKSGVRGDDIP